MQNKLSIPKELREAANRGIVQAHELYISLLSAPNDEQAKLIAGKYIVSHVPKRGDEAWWDDVVEWCTILPGMDDSYLEEED